MTAYRNYYQVLKVSPHASDEAVRQAYHALAQRWHPDRNAPHDVQAQHMFLLTQRAYTMLRTKPQRRAYSRYLLKKNQMIIRRPDTRLVILLKALCAMFWPFTLGQEIQNG